ncbi:hypothetical protein BST61_g1352 [Cercospora zeina]
MNCRAPANRKWHDIYGAVACSHWVLHFGLDLALRTDCGNCGAFWNDTIDVEVLASAELFYWVQSCEATSKTRAFCEWVPRYLRTQKPEHWKSSEDGEGIYPFLNPSLMSAIAKEKRFWEWAPLDCFGPPGPEHELLHQDSPWLTIRQSWIKTAAKLCTLEALETSTESYLRMLVTHPPAKTTDTAGHDRTLGIFTRQTAFDDSSFGVRFAALLKTAGEVLSTQTRMCSDARPFGFLELSQICYYLLRVFPESPVDHVTGWEMLALLSSELRVMNGEIDRIIEARKKWDHVAGGESDEGTETKEVFAWGVADNTEIARLRRQRERTTLRMNSTLLPAVPS